jgi:hypothetical protein
MGTTTVSQNTGVLTSWKEIARYMGKGVRTVQRWEMDFGLPVRRPQGSNKKAVLARPRDLDAWVALRCASRVEQQQNTQTVPYSRIARLAQLEAQMETARQLRETNQALVSEVKAQMHQLREQIVKMQTGR